MSRPEANNILVSSLLPLEKHEQFSKWPLHVTLLPWFSLPERYRPVFLNRLANYTYRVRPVTIVGGEEADFGSHGETRVRLLQSVGTLSIIHNDILAMVEELDGKVDSDWIGHEYQPHVTRTKDAAFDQGQIVRLDQLQLIRRNTETGRKVVEHVLAYRGDER